MLRKKVFGIIVVFLFLAVSGAILSTGCYDDDKARIIIHLERNDLAVQKEIKQKNIIDRVLEFFSTPAEASFPPLWSPTQGNLTLTITSAEFDKKTFSIPAGTTTFSTIIPAVNNVTFEIIAVSKNWGGHKTLSITPGDQEVTIKMIPMVSLIHEFGYANLQWTDLSSGPVNVDAFNLYRSKDINGPYTKIATIVGKAQYSYFDDLSAEEIDITYYYRMTVIGSDGEGMMSDPLNVLNNP
jgi:hypothetical protein